MKKLLFIAALPLLFSACKQPEPTTPVADSASPEATAPRASLPRGLALSVPYNVISDEWVDEGEERKRMMVIEFERADIASIGREITEGMVNARYRLTGTAEARGGQRFNFRGDPGLQVSILVRPRKAVALQSAAATGNIEYTYREPREAVATGQDAD